MMMTSLMSHMRVGVRAVFAFAAFLVAVAAPARAGVMPPDYGIQWCTVGGGTNRPANAQELAGSPWVGTTFPFNPVSYEFRIAKTEITNAQWIDFYRAYRQFVSPIPSAITGGGIVIIAGVPTVRPGYQNIAATMGWEFAARYCNWLHNGKAMTREAFEQGVYDASTFYRDANGVNQHQVAPAPGAKFWIPTFDEWIKAAYWDPSKNNGEGGYWRYPNSSDTELIAGPPGTPGAQTNAGEFNDGLFPVGSYEGVRSPWGLLDVSGGVQEYLSTPVGDPWNSGVFVAGSGWSWAARYDRFGEFSTSLFGSNDIGFRIASVAPTPGAFGSAIFLLSSWAFKRRRSP